MQATNTGQDMDIIEGYQIDNMSRAMRSIQSECKRLEMQIAAASDSLDWVVVYRIAERISEVATRGMHRHAMDNTIQKLKTNYREPESR